MACPKSLKDALTDATVRGLQTLCRSCALGVCGSIYLSVVRSLVDDPAATPEQFADARTAAQAMADLLSVAAAQPTPAAMREYLVRGHVVDLRAARTTSGTRPS